MNGLLNRLADSNLRPLATELAGLVETAGLQDVLPFVSAGLLQVGPSPLCLLSARFDAAGLQVILDHWVWASLCQALFRLLQGRSCVESAGRAGYDAGHVSVPQLRFCAWPCGSIEQHAGPAIRLLCSVLGYAGPIHYASPGLLRASHAVSPHHGASWPPVASYLPLMFCINILPSV